MEFPDEDLIHLDGLQKCFENNTLSEVKDNHIHVLGKWIIATLEADIACWSSYSQVMECFIMKLKIAGTLHMISVIEKAILFIRVSIDIKQFWLIFAFIKLLVLILGPSVASDQFVIQYSHCLKAIPKFQWEPFTVRLLLKTRHPEQN